MNKLDKCSQTDASARGKSTEVYELRRILLKKLPVKESNGRQDSWECTPKRSLIIRANVVQFTSYDVFVEATDCTVASTSMLLY